MPTENTPDVAFDVPVESLQTPNAGALAAMQGALADMKPADAPPSDPPAAPPVDPAAQPVDPAAPPADPAAPPADPAAPPVDPAAPPADPATPPADPAAPPADAPPKRPSDEFGELPKDAKAETRERFEVMRTKYDSVVGERDEARAAAQQWYDTISSAGSPEQFGEALQVVRDVNAATPESWKRAYDTLTRQAGILAKALGMPAEGYDPLDEHPDLKARVAESVDFTRDDALLIAQARKQGTLHQTVAAREDQAAQQRRAQDDGIAQVRTLGDTLRAKDAAGFQSKLPALTAIIETVVASLPPDQWVGKIQAAYDKIPAAAAPTPPPTPPVVPNPLRPGVAGSVGVDKQPTTALEAVSQALARGY